MIDGWFTASSESSFLRDYAILIDLIIVFKYFEQVLSFYPHVLILALKNYLNYRTPSSNLSILLWEISL